MITTITTVLLTICVTGSSIIATTTLGLCVIKESKVKVVNKNVRQN